MDYATSLSFLHSSGRHQGLQAWFTIRIIMEMDAQINNASVHPSQSPLWRGMDGWPTMGEGTLCGKVLEAMENVWVFHLTKSHISQSAECFFYDSIRLI